MSAHVIDSADQVSILVDSITDASPAPFLFIDLEGVYLSRHGSISILQILVPPVPVVHLVDVLTLQEQAFTTVGHSGLCMRDILESDQYPKVFFDVRNDSDALYSHFKVRLNCVVDVQLFEFATRSWPSRFLAGLAKCISTDLQLPWEEARCWQSIKEDGQKLFVPEKGGRYEVILERPLPDSIRDYCVQDVMLLPKLLCLYARKVNLGLTHQVQALAQQRVAQSQRSDFNGKGRHMAVGPVIRRLESPVVGVPSFPVDIICSQRVMESCRLNPAAPVTVSLTNVNRPGKATDAKTLAAATSNPIQEALEPCSTSKVPASVFSGQKEPTIVRSNSQERAAKDPSYFVANKLRLLKLESNPSNSAQALEDMESDGDFNDVYSDGYDDFGGDRDSSADYTACSADDCGYCGRCSY